MYTDEPVLEKDVALGNNFSRFSLLTKITVFAVLRYIAADDRQDSWFQRLRTYANVMSTQGNEDI
jgi:hypothetical protein